MQNDFYASNDGKLIVNRDMSGYEKIVAEREQKQTLTNIISQIYEIKRDLLDLKEQFLNCHCTDE
jgi:hypothetical protein